MNNRARVRLRLPAHVAAQTRHRGALGLLVGIWVPIIGIAAAACLALYFLGAVIAHVRSKAVYHSVFCSGGGVTSIIALPAAAHPHGAAVPAAVDYGGRAAVAGGVHVIAGAGDGTLTVYHHAVSSIEHDLVLSAAGE